MSLAVRRAVLFAVPLLCLLAVVAMSLAWAGELPDPLAIHWEFGGRANGFGPLWLLTAMTVALVAGLGLGSLAVQQRVRGPAARSLGGLAVGMSLFLTLLHLGTLQVNRGVSDAAAVESPALALLVAGSALLVGGALGWWISPPGAPVDPAELAVDAIDVAPGEAVVWTGTTAAAQWLTLLAGGTLALSVVVLLVAEPWVAAVLVLAGLGVASLLRVHLTVGPAGLLVRFGPFGLLRHRVPVADVAEVRVEVVEPLAYGGWGYRLVPGVRAIVVRRGPGLRVEREDGPAIVVTIEDARTAAGVLLAHVEAQRGR